MIALRHRDWAAAGLAGLIAGVVLAAAMEAQRTEITQLGLLGLPLSDIGLVVHALVAMAVGVGFGTVFQYVPHGHAAAVSGGVLYGLITWIVGPMTLGVLVGGSSPTWSIEAATTAFPSLIGHLLYGALTGLGFALLASLHRRLWPEPEDDSLPAPRQRIVVVGGGFAGVGAAQKLGQHFARNPEIEVTLVSRSNYLLFTPMLAEVASSSLEPHHISPPLRAAAPRAHFRHAAVEAIDTHTQSLRIRPRGSEAAETLAYDQLVLALGATPNFFGMEDVERHAFTLKTLDDALTLREHVLTMLERADAEPDPDERRRLLRFVVVGGGFAGAETVAELFDLAHSVRRFYPNIDPTELHFVLVHADDRILPELGEELAAYAHQTLRERGIDIRLNLRAEGADAGHVRLNDGTELATRTLVWTAGNRPHPLVGGLDLAQTDRGALDCEATLQVAGSETVWAVGDCARIPDPANPDRPCPPTAQHAARQGLAVADNVAAAATNRPDRIRPYAYKSKGMIVVLGHYTAVAEVGRVRFAGLGAWLFWRAVYLAKLPGLEKKVRVAVDWLLDLVFPRDIVLTHDVEPTEPAAPSAPSRSADTPAVSEDADAPASSETEDDPA